MSAHKPDIHVMALTHCFCLWKLLRPHLLHKVCDLEWAFPKEGVPYAVEVPYELQSEVCRMTRSISDKYQRTFRQHIHSHGV
jgi:hypothetical protein